MVRQDPQISVADGRDGHLDSGLLVKSGSFTTFYQAPPTVGPSEYVNGLVEADGPDRIEHWRIAA